jgi:hypothetical protein
MLQQSLAPEQLQTNASNPYLIKNKKEKKMLKNL